MRLKDLVGIKVLDGLHVELLEGARVFWMRLSGSLYAFMETPDGGQDAPSMLGSMMKLREGEEFDWDGHPRTIKLPAFDGIVVNCETRKTNTVGGDDDDVLVIREKMSPRRLICEIGTDRSDDFAWSFVFSWNDAVMKLPDPVEWAPPAAAPVPPPSGTVASKLPPGSAPGTVIGTVTMPPLPAGTVAVTINNAAAPPIALGSPGPRIPILPPTDAQGRPKTTTKPGGWVTETYDDEEEEED